MPEPWPTDDNTAIGRLGGGEPALPIRSAAKFHVEPWWHQNRGRLAGTPTRRGK